MSVHPSTAVYGVGFVGEDACYPAAPRTDEQIMGDARAYIAGVWAAEDKARRYIAEVESWVESWAEGRNLIGDLDLDEEERLRLARDAMRIWEATVSQWDSYIVRDIQIRDAPGLRAWWRRQRSRLRRSGGYTYGWPSAR